MKLAGARKTCKRWTESRRIEASREVRPLDSPDSLHLEDGPPGPLGGLEGLSLDPCGKIVDRRAVSPIARLS